MRSFPPPHAFSTHALKVERIVAAAQYQEGEETTENAMALLEEAGAAVERLGVLLRAFQPANARPRGSARSLQPPMRWPDATRLGHALFTAADDDVGRDRP